MNGNSVSSEVQDTVGRNKYVSNIHMSETIRLSNLELHNSG